MVIAHAAENSKSVASFSSRYTKKGSVYKADDFGLISLDSTDISTGQQEIKGPTNLLAVFRARKLS